jgi:hypothetical protein
MDVPGDTPILPPELPPIVVGPVFVIVVPARTAKLAVVPRFTVGSAAHTGAGIARQMIRLSVTRKMMVLFRVFMNTPLN